MYSILQHTHIITVRESFAHAVYIDFARYNLAAAEECNIFAPVYTRARAFIEMYGYNFIATPSPTTIKYI